MTPAIPIPVLAIGALALGYLFLQKDDGSKTDNGAPALGNGNGNGKGAAPGNGNGAVIETGPANITDLLDSGEYEVFNESLGKEDIPTGALLALLPTEKDEASDALVVELAGILGRMGYPQLGVVTILEEGFDPPRLRLVRAEDNHEEVYEIDTLSAVVAQLREEVDALERGSAGRRVVNRRGRIGYGRMAMTETPSHGRGLRPDGGEVFAFGLNPGEHAAYGRGLMGKSHVEDVSARLRPVVRREMRRVMERGITKNPAVAARIAMNRIKGRS